MFYTALAMGGTNVPGLHPQGGVIRASDGNYYGSSSSGGSLGGGAVFRLTPDGVLTQVASFPFNDGNPAAALIQTADGNLYGTTNGNALAGASNAHETIFRLTLAGQLTTLASFPSTDSNSAVHKLVSASNGNIYGTKADGGDQNKGSIFRLAADGTLTTLVSFNGTNGAAPQGGLVQGSDGNFYGTTSFGGPNNNAGGTLFRMTPAGALTTLFSFSSGDTGNSPRSELTEVSSGTFYGVTSSGGASGYGAVFRLTADGQVSSVAALPADATLAPSTLVSGNDGNLYGTTAFHFFRVTPSGTLTVLAAFDGTSSDPAVGRQEEGPLLRIENGDFFGVTYTGGLNNTGSIYRISEQGSVTPIVSFPKLLGSGFASELTEGSDGQLYGTFVNDGANNPGVFKITKSGVATPLASFFSNSQGGSLSRFIPDATGQFCGTSAYGGLLSAPVAGQTPGGYAFTLGAGDSFGRLFQFTAEQTGMSVHGSQPTGGLTVGADAQLYGTTYAGGAHGTGTFFKLTGAKSIATLASFDSATGSGPTGDLLFADGFFYGLTAYGGANSTGTFFKAASDGTITPLLSFPANISINGRLILASDGNFYGTSYTGGTNGLGGIVALTKAGALSIFASFDNTVGSTPKGVVQANNGIFYGVTAGTFSQSSTIYQADKNGNVAVLRHLDDPAGNDYVASPLMAASDGNLYGTTAAGGATRGGIIYRLSFTPPPTPTPSATATPSATQTPSATATPSGTPFPTPSASPSASPTPVPVALGNISTRLSVGTGENVLIGGFIINGTQPKKVLVRAKGPSLTKLNVVGALANPMLTLVNGGGKVIATNDDWQSDPNEGQIPVNLQPGDPAESAVLTTLAPGNYTAIVSGVGGTTGIALVEAYDLDQTVDSKLANISTRGSVQTGDNVMIGGLIIQGTTSAKVIIRGRGPSLPGVASPLLDPTLDIFDANGGAVASNDNWQTDPGAAEMTADNLAPGDPREAGTLQTLAPGNYTAIVRGANGTTGVGLVEVYNVN